MGGLNVKITMIQRVLQTVAPHPCSGCAKIGTLLCDDCKYDINHEPFLGCILCAKPHEDGICADHLTAFSQVFVAGERTGALEVLINALKFHNTKAAAKTLAEVLHSTLPLFPANTRIIPIPTVASHIRQRGYDQVDLISRYLSELRGYPVTRALVRLNKATQHTSSRSDRAIQAGQAFALAETDCVQRDSGNDEDSYPVLLLDDVITTGATITEAAKVLSTKYKTIVVIALAYQPLD